MNEIGFVDTTLRDGQQSLWAERMTTSMMLCVAEQMDNAGFEAIELISSSHFKKCVRELREDPWERIRLVAKRITKTPLRLIAGRFNNFEITPQSVYRLFIERLAANGLRQIRISDEWNDLSGWQYKVQVAREFGLDPLVNLIFSVSPKHTDEYYARKASEAATLEVSRLCLKDPGGLLTPERTRILVPLILHNSKGKHLEFHTHCTTGLGPLCCLEAIKLGVKTVNTALPPLANSSSNPSFFNVASNARALGYVPTVDEKSVKAVSEQFMFIAKREGFPIGAPVEYDYSQYLHQVPGGMISNLRHQLRVVGLEHRLEETLEEATRVRAEFGYPIMVTPLSQFVGSQAAINVIVGERYKQVTDSVIQYALGRWGKEGGSSMDPNVKDKIMSRSRAKELARWEPPEPSIQELRRKLGGRGVSDEDLLLRLILSKDEIEAAHVGGPPNEYHSARQPLVTLIKDLTKRSYFSQIRMQKGRLSLTLGKRSNL